MNRIDGIEIYSQFCLPDVDHGVMPLVLLAEKDFVGKRRITSLAIRGGSRIEDRQVLLVLAHDENMLQIM